MASPKDPSLLVTARRALSTPLTFEQVLAKLATRDRVNAQRRITVLDGQSDADLSRLWQRLASTLMTLAPVAKFVGTNAVQFFVPDGRYRMQVFALEDLRDGKMTVYSPDILDDAVAAGLLVPTPLAEPHAYAIAATNEPLSIVALDGSAAVPEAHFKNLTNWNRRALCIAMPPSPSPQQIEAVELLCALAAAKFVISPPPGAAPAT